MSTGTWIADHARTDTTVHTVVEIHIQLGGLHVYLTYVRTGLPAGLVEIAPYICTHTTLRLAKNVVYSVYKQGCTNLGHFPAH
jgi:hypothetical protein